MRDAAATYCNRVAYGNDALDHFLETMGVMRAGARPGATLGETMEAARRAVQDDALMLMERELRACVTNERELQAILLRVQERFHGAQPEVPRADVPS